MGLIERPIPRGLAGLPVGSKRAAKLARKVADRLETPAVIVPLVEHVGGAEHALAGGDALVLVNGDPHEILLRRVIWVDAGVSA